MKILSTRLRALLPFFLLLLPSLVHAGEWGADEEGCKDSKLLTRMPTCEIRECESSEFDTREVQIGVSTADGSKTKALEGKIEYIVYECPEKLSMLQLQRNAENALKKAGFSIVFSGKGSVGDGPAVTAKKAGQWVEVQTHSESGHNPGRTRYDQTAVLVKAMEQDMEATADALAEEIRKSGRVAVYGITFATGKAIVQPESDKVLTEIAALLTKNADWKLRIEGHTDNVGAKVANQKLSEQRGAAVVAWLTSHGVDKSRLTSQGFGDTKPVGDNGTEEGRTKNRRVDLVKP